jgi:hypothetical protein
MLLGIGSRGKSKTKKKQQATRIGSKVLLDLRVFVACAFEPLSLKPLCYILGLPQQQSQMDGP